MTVSAGRSVAACLVDNLNADRAGLVRLLADEHGPIWPPGHPNPQHPHCQTRTYVTSSGLLGTQEPARAARRAACVMPAQPLAAGNGDRPCLPAATGGRSCPCLTRAAFRLDNRPAAQDTQHRGGRAGLPARRTRGRNSVVECQLPKLDVGGSNPLARCRACRCAGARRVAFPR